MEINATNEARSTENTTKNQTTFRLPVNLAKVYFQILHVAESVLK